LLISKRDIGSQFRPARGFRKKFSTPESGVPSQFWQSASLSANEVDTGLTGREIGEIESSWFVSSADSMLLTP